MSGTKVLGLKVLGLAAVGAWLLIVAPAERAHAMSLINPGAAATVQQDSRSQMTTAVHWHHRRHWGWHRGHHYGWHRHHHRHW
jgi:hypothetical protein